MFYNVCIRDGHVALFIPPDAVHPDAGGDDVFVYEHNNDHRHGHSDRYYDGGASITFSPLSFTALGDTMLYTSPNWWESSWAPEVARGPLLMRFGCNLTRFFLHRFALRSLMTTHLMTLPPFTSCKHTGAAMYGDGYTA